jgi:hypothetical protein
VRSHLELPEGRHIVGGVVDLIFAEGDAPTSLLWVVWLQLRDAEPGIRLPGRTSSNRSTRPLPLLMRCYGLVWPGTRRGNVRDCYDYRFSTTRVTKRSAW